MTQITRKIQYIDFFEQRSCDSLLEYDSIDFFEVRCTDSDFKQHITVPDSTLRFQTALCVKE